MAWPDWKPLSRDCVPEPSSSAHDREFLTRMATRVVEFDLAQQQVTPYSGGY